MTRTLSRRTGRAMLVGLAIVALLAGPWAVAAHAPDPATGSTWAQNARLEFRWRSGSEPPSAIRTAIRAAADGSNVSKGSKAATFVYDASGANPIGYGAGATCGVNGIACYTRDAPDGIFTMWLREHGRVFDWGVLRWCEMYTDPPNGCYDAGTIALDEFGHVQGLNHHDNYSDDSDYLDAVVQTFSRTRPKVGWDEDRYGRCDVARLQLRYDVTSSTARVSTCLKIETVLTLAASPMSIAYGGTTTLTAFLEVTGNDAYGRLQGNNLSERTVKLQRRAPGTSTWTTVATMPPGSSSGTYVLTQKLQTAAEFRATFATPSAEGLVGDSSGSVTVSVSGCTTAPCPLRTPTERTGGRDG